jgi:hypothetical protein
MAPRATAQTQPWDPIRQPADKIKLSGVYSPGICEILGAGSPRTWDEQSGPGWSGGLLIYHGIKLSHFTVLLHMYELQDWADWQKFRPLLLRPPLGSRPRTHTIWHPLLTEVNISACVVEDVRAPQQIQDGEWIIDVSFIEARMPKQGAPIKPEGADAAQTDPREETIERLTGVRDELAKRGAQ